jgi:AraC-like DNA-binding protein
VVDYPPGATFGPRTTHDYELVWLLHGSATWTWAGRVERLAPGSILLVRPGMTDEFRWDERHPTRHAYVHFDFDPAPVEPDSWPLVRHPARDDLLAGLCRYVLRMRATEPPHWRRRFDDAFRLLLATFVAGPLSEGEDAPVPAPIRAVVEFLRDRWAGGRTTAASTETLAAAAAVSPSQLARLFRERFGIGPAAAVEALRLGRAEDLLLRSNLTVGAIAVQCGFADAYHFSRRFRAAYGLPPSRFRVSGPVQPPAARAALLPLQRQLWR